VIPTGSTVVRAESSLLGLVLLLSADATAKDSHSSIILVVPRTYQGSLFVELLCVFVVEHTGYIDIIGIGNKGDNYSRFDSRLVISPNSDYADLAAVSPSHSSFIMISTDSYCYG
jgi:hypothetical protein